jgi:hypothetical protein
MRRGDEHGAACGREEVPAPGRRTFLGVGLGCAVPLIVGTGLGRAGILPVRQDGGGSDAVWGHIASEAWRASREMQGPLGPRDDRRLDEEVRRLVRERGRDAAAREVVSRCQDDPGIPRLGRGRAMTPDAVRMATCLDELVARGCARSLRSRRASLEQLAAVLDRTAIATPGRVVPAAGQKPGDDIGGYPEVPPGPGFCDMLACLIVEFDLLAVFLPMLGIPPAGIAAAQMGAVCELLWFAFCREKEA